MDTEQRTNISAAGEPSVDEGAFWHTNMELYYGYLPGEIVEVEHEPTKYWLAKIEFSYRHLVLLKWLGDYGEDFWIDTSFAGSVATGSSNNASSSSIVDGDNSFLRDYPRRLFPLGHHMQPQIKSQFRLEKPTKILVKPSLYNPAKDPYANIKTVEDLLAHELDVATNETNEPPSLVLAKNNTKINYGQEDVDELEAALMNLNDEIGREEAPKQNEQAPTNTVNSQSEDSVFIKDSGTESDASNTLSDRNFEFSKCSKILTTDNLKGNVKVNEGDVGQDNASLADPMRSGLSLGKPSEEQQDKDDDTSRLETCRRLQESAMSKGRYMAMEPRNNNERRDEIYFLKPKQFFDIGGANHERVFVPGTLIEVCHSIHRDDGLTLAHWFAFVIKNIGGRLTLRWLICDEPKFKQGRIESKSCKSFLVDEEDSQPDNGDHNNSDSDENKRQVLNKSKGSDDVDAKSINTKIPAKSITFSLHFCDPKIHTISYAKQNGRVYKFPDALRLQVHDSWDVSAIQAQKRLSIDSVIESLASSQIAHVFDTRRMNLDKDRPLIDHLLSTIRNKAPNYLDLVFATKDIRHRREVLISCPKMTKLLRGYVKQELEQNVFEVNSDPSPDGEIIRFIYPYDSSYAILPKEWAECNPDCLSMDPGQDPSSVEQDERTQSDISQNNQDITNFEPQSESQKQPISTSSNSCLLADRSIYPRVGGSHHKLPKLNEAQLSELKQKISNFDEHDPRCWSDVLRKHELEAATFHCCVDYSLKGAIESKFRVMDQLEVVHPSSDLTICSGRIRKVVFPLIWIQISADSFTLLPFNSTNIYPAKWCETYQHPLMSFLPPRKRQIDNTPSQSQDQKRKKKLKVNDDVMVTPDGQPDYDRIYVKESFDLGTLESRQSSIDCILNEKSMYIKIFFNHKCFTGPSLSKSKICTLPQYVGPGPMRLVMEEVVTKVISVAYVPPRILNDLSSKSFEELLILRNLTNTSPVEFKAKYQKRVHRETIPVCLSSDDVALYCECLCEHLKCCYNLFGPNQYDGDDCPGHCRALTKSNKYMKRATYYRDKARAGEFVGNSSGDNHSTKKGSNDQGNCNNKNSSTSRPRYGGRGSSGSTSSNVSRTEQVASRASSSSSSSTSNDDLPLNDDIKSDTLNTVPEENEQLENGDYKGNDENICCKDHRQENARAIVPADTRAVLRNNDQHELPFVDCGLKAQCNIESDSLLEDEFETIRGDSGESIANDPHDWSVDDVCRILDACGLNVFIRAICSESIDGPALLLLDEITIEEHFQKLIQPTEDKFEKFCRFVEFAKVRLPN